jgi:hypothetical protein
MFSLTVPGKMKGSYSTYAILPLISMLPFTSFVSLRMDLRSVVLPDPTYPITTINYPDFKVKFTFYKASLGGSASGLGGRKLHENEHSSVIIAQFSLLPTYSRRILYSGSSKITPILFIRYKNC